MASIAKEQRRGRVSFRIQWIDATRKRKSVRLAAALPANETKARQDAEETCGHIEELLAASRLARPVARETAKWLARVSVDIYEKLATTGLVERRTATLLGEFTKQIIDGRKDWKPSTKEKHTVTRKHLIDFFGETADVSKVSPGAAERWRQHLVDSGKAKATIAKMVKHGRYFFQRAVAERILDENPFKQIKAGREENSTRLFMVDQATIMSVIAAAPDAEWRAIIALARFGGLRCPSEVLALQWDDIDWQANTMRVRSPKTEHHDKAERIIPLFGELRPCLDELHQLVGKDTRFVVNSYRNAQKANLRTRLCRIIESAGVKPWPKTFQNLRASRASELANRFPLHTVAQWLGHTPKVAEKHYLRALQEHFSDAVGAKVVHGVQFSGVVVQNRCSTPKQLVAANSDGASLCDDLPNAAKEKAPPAGECVAWSCCFRLDRSRCPNQP